MEPQKESNGNLLEEMRDYKVVKSNDLIQRTRFILTTLEQKIILYLISKIKPDNFELEESEFKIREFYELCMKDGDNGANYRYIKHTLKNLRDKSIWFKLPNGSETTLAWFSRVTMNENNGTVKIKFDDIMKPHLLQLKEQFTQFSIRYILAMKSLYSIRLYELLKSYESMKEWTYEVQELKQKLFAETYIRYPDFRRKVIDIAVREINNYGDISVQYTVEKNGNKVTHINFQIKTRTDIMERVNVWTNIESALENGKKKSCDNAE